MNELRTEHISPRPTRIHVAAGAFAFGGKYPLWFTRCLISKLFMKITVITLVCPEWCSFGLKTRNWVRVDNLQDDDTITIDSIS